ncbi:hypothetical protein P3W45_001083 [Vairimorpha bombi]|jgi:26S proteasome regulatory subunit N5
MNEALFEKERLARKEGDIDKLKSIFLEMLSGCSTDKEIVSLIKILSVRRGQNREAIRWLVNEVYSKKRESENFIKLLLSEVVEGKMYLERERVDYTLDLMNRAKNYEDALRVILDVPIETFTLVDDTTIIRYQLDQFRLCVEVKDYIRASIIMKRIRQKYFEEHRHSDERLHFFMYKIQFLLGQDRYLEASRTYILLNESSEKTEYSIMASFFCILSTEEETKKEVLDILYNDKNNEESMRIILDKFRDNLLISKETIQELEIVTSKYLEIDPYIPQLCLSIDEHNYKIIEKYYSEIDLSTFSRLMDLKEEDLVRKISFMVNNKYSKCKINQKEGVVVFESKQWNEEVEGVMDKLIKVDHLIHKESLKINK